MLPSTRLFPPWPSVSSGSVPAGMTVKGSVSVSVSEVPARALVPVPLAVTVRLTSTTVLVETSDGV